MKRLSSALAVLLSIVINVSCVPGLTTPGSSGSGGSGACGGDMGTTQAAARIEAFLAAASSLDTSARALERDTLAACQRMGRALGMAESELAGTGQDGMRQVCSAVNQRFRGEIQALRSANVQITLMARPPQCQVSVDAYARCAASCEVNVDPGSIEIQCQGGEIRGQCSATCTGSCSVEVHAACSGTCEGACEGSCAVRNADGSCNGQCSGTCHGQCVAQAQASCSGECRGGCSVEFQRPYCATQVQPASVSAECDAACDAHVEAQATCQPGEIYVSVTGTANGDLAGRLERVRMAAREGLSSIVDLRVRAQRLAANAAAVVRLFPGAAQGAIRVSATAASCMATAATGVVQSMASVQVSVQVNVEVSASVSGSAG